MSVPPIHVITPVWGRAYTRTFLDIGLRSLLAPGNLSGLAGPGNVIQLFTTATDLKVIEQSSVWTFARQAVECRVEIIGEEAMNVTNPHETMSHCHRKAVEQSGAAGAAIMFYNPDIVIADGGMRSLVRLLSIGKRAIQCVGLRLQKENVVPLLLRDHVTADGRALVISSRELLRVAMPNLHPITKMHIDGAEDRDLMPQEVFWLADDRGILARCFHVHPILVFPRVSNAPFSTTVDDDYLRAACPDPDDEYVVENSDEFCVCELSSMQRTLDGMPRQPRTRGIASWAWNNARAHHLEHFARRIFLHTDGAKGPEWIEVSKRSDAVVNRVFAHLLDFERNATRSL
jgi:hypothetical protein